MAGYSGTPLVTKLGIKPGHTLFLDGAPDLDLGDLAGVTVVRRLPRQADVTLTFHTQLAALGEAAARALRAHRDRRAWSGSAGPSWRRRRRRASSPTSTTNLVRELGLDLGFVDVKVAAVDETWSGQKFVRRLADPLAGRPMKKFWRDLS